jgi:hypothetical protein
LLIEQLLRSNDQSILDELARKQSSQVQIEAANTPLKCDLDKLGKQSCPPNEACLFDELHQTHVCTCQREKDFVRLQGVCREYIPNGLGCLLGDDCGDNEECLTLYTSKKHGTCQCKLGYKRNRVNFKCESQAVEQAISSNNIVTTSLNLPIQDRQSQSPVKFLLKAVII